MCARFIVVHGGIPNGSVPNGAVSVSAPSKQVHNTAPRKSIKKATKAMPRVEPQYFTLAPTPVAQTPVPSVARKPAANTAIANTPLPIPRQQQPIPRQHQPVPASTVPETRPCTGNIANQVPMQQQPCRVDLQIPGLGGWNKPGLSDFDTSTSEWDMQLLDAVSNTGASESVSTTASAPIMSMSKADSTPMNQLANTSMASPQQLPSGQQTHQAFEVNSEAVQAEAAQSPPRFLVGNVGDGAALLALKSKVQPLRRPS